MIVRDIAKELNLYGMDVDWKRKSLKETLEFNGYEVIDKDYVDKEYSDIKAYLEVGIIVPL